MFTGQQIAFIGGGNMTEALVSGLLKTGQVAPAQIIATDIRPERLEYLARSFSIRVSSDNARAVSGAHMIVLSVEPQILDEVLRGLTPSLDPDVLIVSVAAGYPLSRLNRVLARTGRSVRAMPNTPSIVGRGATALALSPDLSPQDIARATALFESVGSVTVVEERLMDAVTGLSGSGPAYVFLIIEALADGGVKAGLPRPVAAALAAQTVLGAATMVLETGLHPAELKDRVASPGGTTIAGLHALEQGGLRAALMSAVEAAAERSTELGCEPPSR
ncbi:Pyrroline-5-carboxylate reductase [Nitrospira tepida]|uniref:Pyrroline-5-carboxylate reductase n=1 Tax=Nitrospira tepida TaxID=2973512 RepID=A0AA86T5A9_9BACT|nr:pyrroline-5-carboxylate reductase [Nitrospira tepida]CAI4032385.1 Pyrroline-5-carboxylate reductase [Nitrospira tepida]